ncbi:hypothetical protein BDV27DRAFT_130642 [Aspergillus caelatus]|uniref:Uncharacterized protein n=2 Tax=Aspergillus subgen. Circumdati TaxID=2720871 RepID=A0A5N7A191_9EURO|nr:uncharacterized protein BDV27DRAFT_130642 [Aspergillus caelatus]KAE8362969.1 hypothetical protein BDV27DRAFT_130642 [Aspergillus caelatus]KAE8410985.1 hypothetical protein BDV36DRAFT_302258 [Aspergillus pseudocaelatus]
MEAGSDTQSDVDLLILDYLLCISIYRLVYTSGVEQPNECDLDWHINTVHAFESFLPHSGLLPDDIQVKVQLFKFANALRYYPDTRNTSQAREPRLSSSKYWSEEKSISLSELAGTFITLCYTIGARLSEATWADTAAQFVMQAAVEEYRKSESSASLSKHITWAKNISDQTASKNKAFTDCMSYLQPPDGTSVNVHMRTISAKFPINKFKCAVFDTLVKIMKVLEPPILIQLERGQLWGLSRAETKQLKDRVGLK